LVKKVFIMAMAALILAFGLHAAQAAPLIQGHSALLSAAKGAVLELNDIVIRKMGDSVNFRVKVKNIGDMPAKNLKRNLVIHLRVKDPATGQWRELQQWSNIDMIKSGQIAARDYIPVKITDPALMSGKFILESEIVLQNAGRVMISRAVLEKNYPEDAVKQP